MPATISTIRRVVILRGVSVTKSALSVPAFGWQSAQSRPRFAEMTPMLAMKSSTVSSLSVLVVTFLNATPAFRADDGGAGLWAATAKQPSHTAATPAIVTFTRHEVVMVIPQLTGTEILA